MVFHYYYHFDEYVHTPHLYEDVEVVDGAMMNNLYLVHRIREVEEVVSLMAHDQLLVVHVEVALAMVTMMMRLMNH